MGTCHTYLCWVIFICVGSGRRRGLKWFVKNVVTVLQNIQHPVCQPTFPICHSAVRPLTRAPVMALSKVHLSKAVGNGCIF